MRRYTFEIEEERKPFRTLRIAAPGSATLADLARRIQAGLDLPLDQGWSFFRSGMIDDRSEYGSEHRAERDAAAVVLDRLALRKNARMAYQHGEGWECVLQMRVLAVEEGDDTWDAPPVPPRGPETPASLTARARAMLGRSLRSRELDPEGLRALRREELAFARELLDVGTGPESFGHLCELMPLAPWLEALPVAAADAGLVDEALEFALWLATCCGDAKAYVARAVIYAKARKRKKARKQLEDVVTYCDDDPEVLRMAAGVCGELGELALAERCLRAAIASKGEDGGVQRANALDELEALLAQTGRPSERTQQERVAAAAELGDEDDPRIFEDENGAREMTMVRRIDPCPCGSGKLHKDCCYDVPPDDELEWGLLCDALDPLVDGAICEQGVYSGGNTFAADFAGFAGELYAGLSFTEVMPLVPDENLDWVYAYWWLMDRTEPSEVRRYLAGPGATLPKRERRLLEIADASFTSLYVIERTSDEKAVEVTDVLRGPKFRTETQGRCLFYDDPMLVIARFIDVDGQPMAMSHFLVVNENQQEVIALARERFDEFDAAHPELEDPALLKAFTPLLVRAWLDAFHADPAEAE